MPKSNSPSLRTVRNALEASLPGRAAEVVRHSDLLLSTAFALLKGQGAENDQFYGHSMACALHLARAGLSHEIVCLAMLHHLPNQAHGLGSLVSSDFEGQLRALSDLAANDMSAGGAAVAGGPVYPYENAKVAEALQTHPDLIFVLLASALETLASMSKKVAHPAFELALSEDPKEFADDVFDYLVPFAHFYHLNELSWQIEDAVMSVINPTLFERIRQNLPSQATARREFVDVMKARISSCLRKAFGNRGRFLVQGRSKGIFSIAKKLQNPNRQDRDLWNLTDYLALRIVIEDYRDLFGKGGAESLGDAKLSENEKIYRASMQVAEAIAGEFGLAVGLADDYLHYPTQTGYRALHIGVPLPDDLKGRRKLSARIKAVEIQIRTKELHEKAEFGEWAHFKYKLQTSSTTESTPRRDAKRDWGANWASHFEEIVPYRAEDGSLRFMPRGATYADAAYSLIPIGSHPLKVAIENPDTTEERSYEELFESLVPLSRLVVRRSGRATKASGKATKAVSPAAISAVRTVRARQGVVELLDSTGANVSAAQRSDTLCHQGREVLRREQALSRRWAYGLDEVAPTTEEAIRIAAEVTSRPLKTVDELLTATARGEIDVRDVVESWSKHLTNKATIKFAEGIQERKDKWKGVTTVQAVLTAGRIRFVPLSSLQQISGHLQEHVALADCCGPLPGDHIVGWDFNLPAGLDLGTARRVSIIHRVECLAKRVPRKRIKVQGDIWKSESGAKSQFGHIEFLCYDRPGLLNLLTTTILASSEDANIGDIVARNIYDQTASIWLEVSARDREELKALAKRVQDQLQGLVIMHEIDSFRPI